ncbi:hypothetical protein [Egicoccus sp. AB-alg2]|uniref:hypothetical protein n=1 Tax=Egicoccus sp. AB-alg2 TaxID=3242693 RepID=UPI00359EBBB9
MAALVGLLLVQAAAAVGFAVFVTFAVLREWGTAAAPDPSAVGVLSVGATMLLGVVALALVCAGGLWRGRHWAGTITGLLQAVLLVGAGVGLLSLGWQPALGLVAAAGVLGLLLLAGRRREVPT